MNKFKYHFLGALVFLGTIISGLAVYAAMNWSNVDSVQTGNTLTADIWNNTMTAIKGNVDDLDNKLTGKTKMLGGLRQYTDASFDCTFGGEFPNGETSFKYNLGNGVYMCQYMFYVGNANNQSDFLWVCPSKGLKDAGGNKFALSWRKDATTWASMWSKARNTSPVGYGVFMFFDNVGDWAGNHHIGIDLIFHYTQPNNALPQHGNHLNSTWSTPAIQTTQRSDYSTYGFVMCEL